MARTAQQARSAVLKAARTAAATELLAPIKRGRQPAILINDKTLKDIKNLARLHCTDGEISAFLGVTQVTFIAFKRDHPEIVDLLNEGRGEGKISLRRAQFKLAVDGQNGNMQIFLGKQYLGQSDKHEFTGKNGGPIQTVDVSALSQDQLDALDGAIAQLDAATESGDQGGDSGGEESPPGS